MLKNSQIQKQNLYGYKLRAAKRSELKRCSKQYIRNHTKYCKLLMSFNDLEQVPKEIEKKKQTFSCYITFKINENTFVGNFFFGFDIFLSHCFSLLSAFLSSKPFRNNQMYCELIDCYFYVFFVQIQLKKQNLKSIIWNTNLPKGLDFSLHISVKHTSEILIF